MSVDTGYECSICFYISAKPGHVIHEDSQIQHPELTCLHCLFQNVATRGDDCHLCNKKIVQIKLNEIKQKESKPYIDTDPIAQAISQNAITPEKWREVERLFGRPLAQEIGKDLGLTPPGFDWKPLVIETLIFLGFCLIVIGAIVVELIFFSLILPDPRR